MGNAGSNIPRERHKSSSSDIMPSSPIKDGQAFTFEKKPDTRLVYQGSQEDEEQPYYTKSSSGVVVTSTATAVNTNTAHNTSSSATQDNFNNSDFSSLSPMHRQRSNTVSEGTNDNKTSLIDTPSSADNSIVAEEEKKPALPTVFKWDGGGKQVYISGTFSNWKALPMVKSHGDFVTIIDLPEGDHQYKFCVDGEWKHDPKLKNIENDIGTKNNLVSVRQSDFEVFQALAKDSEDAANQGQKEYSQDIPQIKPWEKVSGPPVLPPHLLQVILNKDTPLSCEPTLLPEPNHVMLNHLYALSIKDGVMVLSATHRYRKKYVTTLLYKPI